MTEFTRNTHALGYIESVPRPTQDELNAFYKDHYYAAGVSATYQVHYSQDEVEQKQLRAAACNGGVGAEFAPQHGCAILSGNRIGRGFSACGRLETGMALLWSGFSASPR